MKSQETQIFLEEIANTGVEPIPYYSTLVEEIYAAFPVEPDSVFYKVLEGSLDELRVGHSLQRSSDPNSWLGRITDLATKIHAMGQHVVVRDVRIWNFVLAFDPAQRDFYVGQVLIPPQRKDSGTHSFYMRNYPPSHGCFGGIEVINYPSAEPQLTTIFDVRKQEFRRIPHALVAYVLQQDSKTDTEGALVLTKQWVIPFLGKRYAGVMAEGRIYPNWPDTNTSLAPLSKTIALVPKLHVAEKQVHFPRTSLRRGGIEARL
jgi:hypothetical protein